MDQQPTHSSNPSWTKELGNQARELAARSRELLKTAMPDTFLGRKTQEPFPTEDPMERTDIQNLIQSELQPPKS
jgi:hypothetical protein